MERIQSTAALILAPSDALTLTTPSSLMSTLAPVVATISRITLPPVPITSRILSVGMEMVSIFGANSPTSSRGASMALFISTRM